MLLVALAGAALLYPLWWNLRSAEVGHALVRRALAAASSTATDRPLRTLGRGRRAAPACRAEPRPGALEIPSISLVAPVLQGLDNATLAVAVGHDPATVWPGARGESVLLAHDVSYFSELDRLRPGATILWRMGCGHAVFRVIATLVSQPGAVLPVPAGGAGLALITCWPTNALFWTPARFVVEARLVRSGRGGLGIPVALPGQETLTVPAAASLAALGLMPGQPGVLVGRLTISGSPSPAFREGPRPLALADDALHVYAAADKAAAAASHGRWSALSLPGVPLPAPWSLAYDTNVTLIAKAAALEGAVLSSPAARVTLAVRGSELLVSGVHR